MDAECLQHVYMQLSISVYPGKPQRDSGRMHRQRLERRHWQGLKVGTCFVMMIERDFGCEKKTVVCKRLVLRACLHTKSLLYNTWCALLSLNSCYGKAWISGGGYGKQSFATWWQMSLIDMPGRQWSTVSVELHYTHNSMGSIWYADQRSHRAPWSSGSGISSARDRCRHFTGSTLVTTTAQQSITRRMENEAAAME